MKKVIKRCKDFLFEDPRILFVMFFAPLLYHVFYLSPDNRNVWNLLFSLLACIVVDVSFHRFFRGIYVFPFSGTITAMGVFMVSYSPVNGMYVLAGTLAIASKHILRFKGKHIFNPTNFGAVVAWFYFPDLVIPAFSPWGASYLVIFFVVVTGVTLAYFAKRLPLVLTYCLFFMSIFQVRIFFFDLDPKLISSFLHGASFYLFLFYMVTDPATTPRSNKDQVTFAFVLASMDHILKSNEVFGASFFALFFVSLGYRVLVPILRDNFSRRANYSSSSLL